MEVVLDLEFEQAVFGAEVGRLRLPRRCDDCAGTGAGEGTQPVTCADCNGAGQVRRVRQSMLGQMMTTSACPQCSGLGEVIATPCSGCRGEGRITAERTYQVEVPAGVDTGATLRLSQRGGGCSWWSSRRPVCAHSVAAHERYEREETDLLLTCQLDCPSRSRYFVYAYNPRW